MKVLLFSILILILQSILLKDQVFSQFREADIRKRKGEFALAKISLGWEFTRDQQVTIFRSDSTGKKAIGVGKVVKIRGNDAYIQILSESAKMKVKKGDWVSSDQEDYAILLKHFKKWRYSLKFKIGYGNTPLHGPNQSIANAIRLYNQNEIQVARAQFTEGSPMVGIEWSRRFSRKFRGSLSLDGQIKQVQTSGAHSTSTIHLNKSLKNLNLIFNFHYYYESFSQKYKLYFGGGLGLSYLKMDSHIDLNYVDTPQLNIDARGDYHGLRFTELLSLGIETQFSATWGFYIESQFKFRKVVIIEEKYSGQNHSDHLARAWNPAMKTLEMDFSGGQISAGVVYYW